MPRKRDQSEHDPRWQSHIQPAPGKLRIVQALVNSDGAGGGREELRGPLALADWLERWGLLSRGVELGAEDLERMTRARAGFKAMIRANQQPPDLEAMAALDRVAAAAPVRVRITSDGGARFESVADGLDEALGRVFQLIATAQDNGIWRCLKSCHREDCQAAFYDFSKSQNAKWCSARCGGKVAAKTYRQRRKRYQARAARQKPLTS